MRYHVYLREIYGRLYEVEAESKEEAFQKAKDGIGVIKDTSFIDYWGDHSVDEDVESMDPDMEEPNE